VVEQGNTVCLAFSFYNGKKALTHRQTARDGTLKAISNPGIEIRIGDMPLEVFAGPTLHYRLEKELTAFPRSRPSSTCMPTTKAVRLCFGSTAVPSISYLCHEYHSIVPRRLSNRLCLRRWPDVSCRDGGLPDSWTRRLRQGSRHSCCACIPSVSKVTYVITDTNLEIKPYLSGIDKLRGLRTLHFVIEEGKATGQSGPKFCSRH